MLSRTSRPCPQRALVGGEWTLILGMGASRSEPTGSLQKRPCLPGGGPRALPRLGNAAGALGHRQQAWPLVSTPTCPPASRPTANWESARPATGGKKRQDHPHHKKHWQDSGTQGVGAKCARGSSSMWVHLLEYRCYTGARSLGGSQALLGRLLVTWREQWPAPRQGLGEEEALEESAHSRADAAREVEAPTNQLPRRTGKHSVC